MTKDYSEFPNYETAKKAINLLKQKNWPNPEEFKNIKEFIKEVEKLILSEFEIFPNILLLQKQNKFPLKIFRAREVKSFTNIDLFTEHSYPPIDKVKYGRCNLPQYPVFYGSNNALTALIEASTYGNYKNRTFCISVWSMHKTEKDFNLQTFLQSELHATNYFSELAKSEIEGFNKSIDNKLSKSQEKGLKEFLKYLHDSFINDENYAISSVLAHRAIYAPHNYATDLLIYPSKQTQLRGVNFAIRPNFVDNEMKVERFYIVEMESYNSKNGKVQISINKFGSVESNMIYWKNISQDDKDYKDAFMNDFKSMLPDNYELKLEKINK